jgi:LmbE family N-acetylglucosaminyl deacetylase
MRWIYLSPHLDDVVLSCAAILWQQVQAGQQVEIWSIFAGDPPAGELPPFALTLHERWKTGQQAYAVRRAEDRAACAVLGALPRHLHFADCIYRRLPSGEPLINENEQLFNPIAAQEQPLLEEISDLLRAYLPRKAMLISPLSIGGHVDHRIVRAAAERLPHRLGYYADYPYTITRPQQAETPIIGRARHFPLPPAALDAWMNAVACHVSQISTFWPNEQAMRQELQTYAAQGGGQTLWFQPRRKNH